MNLIFESNLLSFVNQDVEESTMSAGPNAVKAEKEAPEGINGIKMGDEEMSEDGGVLPAVATAAAVPAAIIGWQKIRHKVGF